MLNLEEIFDIERLALIRPIVTSCCNKARKVLLGKKSFKFTKCSASFVVITFVNFYFYDIFFLVLR